METLKGITRAELSARYSYDPDTGLMYSRAGGAYQQVGTVRGPGYVRFTYWHDGKMKHLCVHRVAFLLMTGHVPPLVDHANRNKIDNRWFNLRETTKSANARNSSRYDAAKGVSIRPNGHFTAVIKIDGVPKYVGTRKNRKDAEELYQQARAALVTN